jgi:NAD-dependent deacetylase
MRTLDHETPNAIFLAAELIKRAKHGVVLSGAGISTPSGIPDFRSDSGLWKRFNLFEVATLSAFRYRPEKFFNWLRLIVQEIAEANPNPAHLALADLEKSGSVKTIITQNVDGLHQRAGSKHVLEIHGTLATATCIRCYKTYEAEDIIQNFLSSGDVPHCTDCLGVLKPDIILFEEQLPHKIWVQAEEASRQSDLFFVIGSSLEVMPVAGLPLLALDRGASLIIINKSDTYLDVRAQVLIRGDVAEVLPQIVAMAKTI